MILAQVNITTTATDTLILKVPGDKIARRIIIANRDTTAAAAVTLYAVPFDQNGPPNAENEILGDININKNRSVFINQGEIELKDREEIWAKGTSATLDIVVTVMT
jgi:hypothetical protein